MDRFFSFRLEIKIYGIASTQILKNYCGAYIGDTLLQIPGKNPGYEGVVL